LKDKKGISEAIWREIARIKHILVIIAKTLQSLLALEKLRKRNKADYAD